MSGERFRKALLFVFAVVVAPGIVMFAAKNVYKLQGLGPIPEPLGRVTKESSDNWARIKDPETPCVLLNNIWNIRQARQSFAQAVFLEDVNGKTFRGWRWRAPWQLLPTPISLPQLLCGDTPWDEPSRRDPIFPFQPASKQLTADFSVRLRAAGTYNMAFTMWAVDSLPASPGDISREIMIWTVDGGQPRLGDRRDALTVSGTTFDVYVKENQHDSSAAGDDTWTYVAFIARTPMLKGPLDIGAFIDYLLRHRLLARSDYITSLSLGNEVSEGTGIVEVDKFSLGVH